MNPEIPEPTLDPAVVLGIQKGVAEFNSGKFFECHDTLEEIWQGTRGPARDFFQGLIQISVGFYHLRNGNLRGGQSQLEKGLKALQRYGDRYAGMELENLRSEVGIWLERVRAGQSLRAQVADLPKYHFTPS
jgi:predicted metal-dependent hydrolase